MKKILFFVILLIPFMVKADSNSINISCPDKIRVNTEGECTITGVASSDIDAITAELILSDNLSLVSFTPNASWTGGIENGNLSLSRVNSTTRWTNGDFDIGTLTVKASSYVYDSLEHVGFTDVKFSFEENTYSGTTVYEGIIIPNNDNTLKELSIDNGILSPSFDPNVTEYTASSADTSLNITAIPNSKTATVQETGEVELSTGRSIININVTAEDGRTRTYKITFVGQVYEFNVNSGSTTTDNETTNNGEITNNSENTNNNSSSNNETTGDVTIGASTDDSVSSNASTGSFIIYVIILVGILAIAGMTVYYLKLTKKK